LLAIDDGSGSPRTTTSACSPGTEVGVVIIIAVVAADDVADILSDVDVAIVIIVTDTTTSVDAVVVVGAADAFALRSVISFKIMSRSTCVPPSLLVHSRSVSGQDHEVPLPFLDQFLSRLSFSITIFFSCFNSRSFHLSSLF
jgi:hypothetical protein